MDQMKQMMGAMMPQAGPQAPQGQPDASLWQRIMAFLRASPEAQQQAGLDVSQGLHDQFPEPLRIDPLLQQNKQKEALIDAMLGGAR